jgi:hypothetical protein
MAQVPNYAIMRYNIPLLGEWIVDESLTIYRNGEKIVECKSIPAAKSELRRMIQTERESMIQRKKAEIRELEDMAPNIESYRIKF